MKKENIELQKIKKYQWNLYKVWIVAQELANTIRSEIERTNFAWKQLEQEIKKKKVNKKRGKRNDISTNALRKHSRTNSRDRK